jgi:polyhydroxyalkanoate synthase
MTIANPFEAWHQATRKTWQFMTGSVAAAAQAQQASLKATTRSLQLMANTYGRIWGQPTVDVVETDRSDRRFEHEAWNRNPALSALRQAYLISGNWLMEVADGWEAIDPRLRQRAVFWTQQYIDALSPTNYPLTNPEVVEEIERTGGENLVRGFENFLSDLRRGRISQVPQGAFEVGKDLALTPGKVVYRNQLIELIQYAPATDQVREVPMLMIAPWINKYYVMDLRPDNSMFKYLVDAGFTVFAISWKNADSSMRHLDWEDYMTDGPLAALEVIKGITGAERVNVVGYCLGALLTETTLAYMAAVGDETANTATFFTMHQDFGDVGDVAVFISRPEVRFLEWLMSASGGYLDGRNMAATFSMLRSNDLIWRYWVNNYLLGKQPPEFDMLYWNSDGTRVPEAVHSFLLREIFLEDKLAKPDAVKLKGVGIGLKRITAPAYVVATRRDHIVPWRGAYKVRQLLGGPVRFILADAGHIAGIINHPDKKPRPYWHCDEVDAETDPDVWLECAAANKQNNSWWLDWIPWLEARSGEWMAPPSMGNEDVLSELSRPPIADAPGTYVLEQ